MRSEILQRIQTLLTNEDLEAIRKDVRTEIDSFRSLIQEDFRTQRDAWEKEEHEADEKFEFKPSPEELTFNDLVTQFKEREKAWRQRIAEEQRANLEVKTALIDELRKTIQEEENIGAAFARFNEVREKWEATGDVPATATRRSTTSTTVSATSFSTTSTSTSSSKSTTCRRIWC